MFSHGNKKERVLKIISKMFIEIEIQNSIHNKQTKMKS